MRAGMTASPRRALANRGDQAGHDYFASMTDLMLGLVFVFIIVLMVLAFDQQQSAPTVAQIPPISPTMN